MFKSDGKGLKVITKESGAKRRAEPVRKNAVGRKIFRLKRNFSSPFPKRKFCDGKKVLT